MILRSNHNCNAYKYLDAGEQDVFNRAAVQVILDEPDLGEGPEEYKKALLDYYMDRDLRNVHFVRLVAETEFPKVETDAFDTLKVISNAQRWTTDDYLYFHQSCRETISYLTGQIVKSYTCERRDMGRINELTRDIHGKPYLIWTLCFWIWQWRPELIPALMSNTQISSALFYIIRKVEVTPYIFESATEVRAKITAASFRHLLDVVRSVTTVSDRQMPVKTGVTQNTGTPMYFSSGAKREPVASSSYFDDLYGGGWDTFIGKFENARSTSITSPGTNTPMNIIVSPNPSSDFFTVSFANSNNSINDTKLVVCNTVGQILFSQELKVQYGQNLFRLDMRSLPVGAYFLRITSRDGSASAQLIKR